MKESPRFGWLEVITGCMFGGKSEELIRRVRRVAIAQQAVAVFKPEIDTRYGVNVVASHSCQKLDATPIPCADPGRIVKMLPEEIDVVAIDEAQFFSESLVDVCESLSRRGLRVIVAGLDQDSRGKPFGPMGHLLAIADHVKKYPAICTVCGMEATKSQRLLPNPDEQIEVGAADKYAARCRRHHTPG